MRARKHLTFVVTGTSSPRQRENTRRPHFCSHWNFLTFDRPFPQPFVQPFPQPFVEPFCCTPARSNLPPSRSNFCHLAVGPFLPRQYGLAGSDRFDPTGELSRLLRSKVRKNFLNFAKNSHPLPDYLELKLHKLLTFSKYCSGIYGNTEKYIYKIFCLILLYIK